MFNVYLYHEFKKRKNSTAIPDAAGSIIGFLTAPCDLNDSNSSLISPQLRLELANTFNPADYNYVKIPHFGRYYYIDDWGYNADGTWTAYCTVDHLASFKEEIVDSGGYIGRSWTTPGVSGSVPPPIADPAYPPTNEFLSLNRVFSTGLSPRLDTGSIIIGVISSKAPNVGAAKYYKTTMTELTKLIQAMINNNNTTAFDNLDNLGPEALKSLVNPIQFIVSCKWFPYNVIPKDDAGNVITGTEEIKLWSWATGARGIPLDGNNTYETVRSFDYVLPQLTSIAGVSVSAINYPEYPPYGIYSLTTPWGTFDLDGNVMATLYRTYAAPTIKYELISNMVSGTATLCVYADIGYGSNSGSTASGVTERFEFFRREIDLAMDLPLAQATLDYLGMAKSAIGAAASATNIAGWYTNPGGNVAGIANGLLDAAAAAISPTVQSTASGGVTCFTSEIRYIRYQMTRYKCASQAPSLVGNIQKYPALASLRSSGVVSGYVQMDYSTFSGTCTSIETERIKNDLTNGIYLDNINTSP